MTEQISLLDALSPNRTFAYYIYRMVAEGANLDECVRTASGIQDFEDWHQRWYQAAEKWKAKGDEAQRSGRGATARDAYLLACFFYRAAEFYLPETDHRKVPTYLKNNETFEKAGAYFRPPLNRVEIPYDGTTLPGYLYVPAEKGKAFPCVVYVGGADDCKEELHYLGPPEMAERGLACLTFDGPGKGETLRRRGLYTRPDFEVVVSKVIDFLEGRPEVNTSRIGIIGVSTGGYYAARVAGHEPRLKACISWSGLYDVGAGLFDYFPPIREQLRYITGSKDLEDAREKLKEYTLKDSIKKIRCPYLIVHGGNDFLMPPSEAQRAYDEATCPKELKIWEDGLHVCINYFAEVKPYLWDWLADKLK